ncbi:fimbrial protein [Citrobacter youngae]|nr:fimbrial protein [Citrobacter youngae]
MNKTSYFLKCPVGICIFIAAIYSAKSTAATECYFVHNGTDTLSFGDIGSVSPTGQVTSVVTLLSSIKDSSHAPSTDCNVGQGADDLMSKQNGSALGEKGPGGEALFQTNVPGLVYSIKFKMDNTPPEGYIVPSTDWAVIYNVDDSDDKNDFKNGRTGHYYLQVYQTPDYQPGAGHTVTPQPNTIGQFQVGDSGGTIRTISMTNSSFTLTVPQPTCKQVVLNSSSTTSGNQVSLGDDYVASELKGNKSPRDIPFSVTLTGCAGVNHLRAVLSSGSVSDTSNSMLADVDNKNMGVGVQISGSNKIALIPNDSNSYYSIQDSATPDTRVMNFYATLMDDGRGTITTGAFKAMGTFTFTYY